MAPNATSTSWACGAPLEPNPPPTCGAITRICSVSSPRTGASVEATPCGDCVESYMVSNGPSGSQCAETACGSIGLLCSSGVE